MFALEGTSRREIVAHAVLLLVIAPPTVLLCSSMKWIPQLACVCLFVAYAVLHAVLRGERARRAVAVPLLVALFLGAAWTLGVQGALWISPPRTPDGHPVMALGQVFIGSLLGAIAAGAWSYVYFRRWTRSTRLEALVIHIVGAALLAVFAVRLGRGL